MQVVGGTLGETLSLFIFALYLSLVHSGACVVFRLSLAFDDDLDSDVINVAIEEDDRVFMTMVHLVDPHHFVCASSTVSGHLAEASAKNSKPKDF
jgi:hypothetical protein